VDTIVNAGGDAFALQGDVRSSADIVRVVRETAMRLGSIDVLVNNAGSLVKRAPIAEFDDALFDEVLHINARSMLAFCREVVPLMRARGQGGSIINVSSVAARNGGGPGAYVYAGSKGFVSTATHGLAKELAPDGIRVNAVAPGVIQTPFQDRFSTPAILESFKAGIPMGRIGDPDDCTGAFLYLASRQLSGYVTGQILEVNGGQYMP
ncbi:MAG: SDR family oxidoreductase, partial [Variovorax sp.]